MTRHILYMGDEQVIAEQFQNVAVQCGAYVELVETAHEGLKRHNETPYDALAISTCLPDAAGIDACRGLLIDNPELPIVLIAGAGDEHLVTEALTIGVSNFMLRKPEALFQKTLPGVILALVKKLEKIEAIKVTQLAFELHQKLLNEAARLSNLAFWDWDVPTQRAVYLSPEYFDMIGLEPDMKSYSLVAELKCIHPDDLEHYKAVLESRDPDHDRYEVEFRVVRPDGETRHIRQVGQVVRDAFDNLLSTYGTNQDITKQRASERDLIRAREHAQDASRAKSQFLSSMSHELRTPLNAVLGFAQMLAYSPMERLSEKQQEYVEYIMNGGNLLLTLIQQILDLSRVETGQIEIDFVDCDLRAVIKECLSIIRPQAEMRGIHVYNNLDDVCHVYADSGRLNQVVLNLLSNAVKYNGDNGSITVTSERLDDGMVRVNFVDTGPGIARRFHSQVFEPFDRLGRESHSIEGTGIGLTISKQLIELMNGRISFHSEEGQGATFWIDLPATSSEYL